MHSGAKCVARVALAMVILVVATAVHVGAEALVLRAPLVQWSVERTVPHDAGAFTQGLFFAHGRLFETTGRRGSSSLREVSPKDGTVLRSEPLAQRYFGEGGAAVGDAVYWLTWTSGRGFVYGLRDFDKRREFTYSGEGWGLTFGDGLLVMSDGSERLTFRDPATFGPVRIVRVHDGDASVRRLNELEWVDGRVLANVWGSPVVAVIDPSDGAVTAWMDLRPLVPEGLGADAVANGLAWNPDEQLLYVTGKLWPVMHVLRIDLP